MDNRFKFDEIELIDAINSIKKITQTINFIADEIGEHLIFEYDEIQLDLSEIFTKEFIQIEYVYLDFDLNKSIVVYYFELFKNDFINPINKIRDEIEKLKQRNRNEK